MAAYARQRQELRARAEEMIQTIEGQATRNLRENPTMRELKPVTEVLGALSDYRRQLDERPGGRELLKINGELAGLLYRLNNLRQNDLRRVRERRHLPPAPLAPR
jgi:hypothetical protein